MSGMAGNSATTSDEASDPITPNIAPNTYYDRAKESASSVAEKLMAPMQPGETKTTTRRLLDIPAGRERRDWTPAEEEQNEKKEQSMLQSTGETVARALGGTSRGA